MAGGGWHGWPGSGEKKLSATEQARGAAKIKVRALSADGLRSTGCVHVYRRFGASGGDCGRGRRARSGAGGLRFPGAAFKKKRSQVVLAFDSHELDVHSIRKMR